VPLYETPVGFKYIGEKLLAGEIVFGAEESAGLTIEGHVPEKDGILADLLAAEMVGASGQTLGSLSVDLAKAIGPFWTRRLDLKVSPEAKAALARRRASPPESFAGRRVASVNLLDGLKLLLDDGSWILVRESGTEPVARVYVEAHSAADGDALAAAGPDLLA
jgi:phosphomannomutase